VTQQSCSKTDDVGSVKKISAKNIVKIGAQNTQIFLKNNLEVNKILGSHSGGDGDLVLLGSYALLWGVCFWRGCISVLIELSVSVFVILAC
jgi:hypothetical protein